MANRYSNTPGPAVTLLYSVAVFFQYHDAVWWRNSRSLTVVANNHFQAKEVTNILQLKAMLTNRKVAVPSGLLVRYPELKDIAAPDAV